VEIVIIFAVLSTVELISKKKKSKEIILFTVISFAVGIVIAISMYADVGSPIMALLKIAER